MKVKLNSIRLKHFSLIVLFAFGLFFLISSCQKSEKIENTTATQQASAKSAVDPNSATARFMDPKRENYIKQKFADPKSKVSDITYSAATKGSPCGPTPPGCCKTFDESHCYLFDEAWADCQTQTEVKAIYRWSVYETMCDDPNSPDVNYSFTVDPGFGTVYQGTAILLEEHFEIINYFCCIDPKCYMVKTFEVTAVIPVSEYSFAANTVNIVTGTSSCLSPSPSISITVPLSIDVYCGYPARGFVDAVNTPSNQVLVSTQCALGCLPMIYSQCPSGGPGGARGLFEYRLLGSTGAFTTVGLFANSQLLTMPGTPPETYEYRLRLYYGSCTSDPLIGTFTTH